MINLALIKTALSNYYDTDNLIVKAESVSGGDIHQSFILTLHGGVDRTELCIPDHLFVKYNSGIGAQVLESEFESLKLINSLCSCRYPKAILYERFDDESILLMSFHSISALSAGNAFNAGKALARQHKHTADKFGWQSENYIGLTLQKNQWGQNWAEFFSEQRLRPMLLRAQDQGLSKQAGNRVNDVIERLTALLGHAVVPSLLHGDLWSGNLGYEPAIENALFYDPAPYYGDREVDLAMTELFGRLPSSFYQAYQNEWPLEQGYERRRPIYNLYHALNHVVLFGASYNGLVEACLTQIDI